MLISFHLIKNLTTNIYNEHANGAEDLVQIRWRTFTKLVELKLSPLLRYICVSELSQPAACSLPSHYLNQFCFIANWTLPNLTLIWKDAFLPILVLFHWYISSCVCISVIKPIIDVPRKLSWKGPILMWTCFVNLGVYTQLLWNQSEKLCFEPSHIATVTNNDTIVAIGDLSQFVIKAVTAQTESNNTENVFWVLGRVHRFTFDMNMKSFIFAHFGAISLVCMFMCMFISYKAHNRCT